MQQALKWKRTAVLAIFMMMLAAGGGEAEDFTYYKSTGSWKGLLYLSPLDNPLGGMSGFKFDFQSSDHHILTISSGFHYVDTQGGLEFIPEINYRDNCGQDSYYWEFSRRALPPGTTIHQAHGYSSGGGFNQRILPPGCYGEPVILGFSYYYANGDHHLDGISLEFTKGADGQIYMESTFYDNCLRDGFYYDITYALVPSDRVSGAWYANGSARASASLPITANNPVLQGFKMDFSNGDHHVDEIGVDLTQSAIRVWYNDTNDDDAFTWRVQFADLQ